MSQPTPIAMPWMEMFVVPAVIGLVILVVVIKISRKMKKR